MQQDPPIGTGFQVGQRVRHDKRPEWGLGTIRQTKTVTRDGTRSQRLTVDFANKGRVTLDSALAPLTPIQNPSAKTDTPLPNPPSNGNDNREPRMSSSGLTNNAGGWLAQLESKANGGKQTHELWDLPDSLSDPFSSDEVRLKATLDTYRYSTEARSLMEWAIAQTGLDDPLTKYNRTELEQAFPRFARDRDNHLKDMVRQLKRNNQHAMIQSVRNHCKLPAAVSALDKAMRA